MAACEACRCGLLGGQWFGGRVAVAGRGSPRRGRAQGGGCGGTWVGGAEAATGEAEAAAGEAGTAVGRAAVIEAAVGRVAVAWAAGAGVGVVGDCSAAACPHRCWADGRHETMCAVS